MELVVGLGGGLVLFLCTVKAYTLGIKHGKQLASNEVPKFEPIKQVIDHVEAKQEDKKYEAIIQDYWK